VGGVASNKNTPGTVGVSDRKPQVPEPYVLMINIKLGADGFLEV